MFRIVEVLKGDCSTGFRVQEEKFFPRAGGHRWMNRGRICYSVPQAREQRDFLMRQADMARPEIRVVTVE
jgi:hypothetical protein